MKTNPVKSQRHFSRVPFSAAVQLHLHDRTISVQLIDIALKGALVKTETLQALVPMEKCRLVLPLTEGGEGIVMAGRIVHLENQHVGIECQDIDVASLTQLRRLIELNTGDGDLMKRELSQLFAKHVLAP
ncbi:MAG: PilZ domain-containing protein [Rhodoferax sp.]|uniref:PilZ domain-containing protein n=1 Tax=Rhodoferax sp. TaxID=50421 RepID=UPI003016F9B1